MVFVIASYSVIYFQLDESEWCASTCFGESSATIAQHGK